MAMEVGFLGLGIMGKAMATNLLRKGFKVTVWNRTLSKVKQQLLYSLLITQIAIYELCFFAVWWAGGDWCFCWRNPSSCSQEVQVHHCNVIWSISCSFGWFYFMLLSSLLPTVKAINIISLVPFFFSFLCKVVFDTDGVLEQVVSGKSYIDMSTVDVDTSSKISEVRAPFSFLSFFHGFIQLNELCFHIWSINK